MVSNLGEVTENINRADIHFLLGFSVSVTWNLWDLAARFYPTAAHGDGGWWPQGSQLCEDDVVAFASSP